MVFLAELSLFRPLESFSVMDSETSTTRTSGACSFDSGIAVVLLAAAALGSALGGELGAAKETGVAVANIVRHIMVDVMSTAKRCFISLPPADRSGWSFP